MFSRCIKNKHFLLTGHSGFYNRGCEAIVRSTVDLLRREWKDSKVDLYSFNPESDLDELNENEMRIFPMNAARFSFNRLINILVKRIPPDLIIPFVKIFGRFRYAVADACLSVGGDNYTLDYGFPTWLITRDRLTKYAGIPLVIWGASIGPFESNPALKTKMKEHLQYVDLITARESVTVKYLSTLGITRNVVRVFDPAFALQSVPYTGPEKKFIESGDVVGLNISALIADWRDDKNLERLLDEVANFLEAATSEGLKFLLIPHVTKRNSSFVVDDEATLNMLIKRVKYGKDNIALLPGNLSTRNVKWMISQCRFFIGARTHSTIAAISSGVPTITIAYSQKARGINRDIFGNEQYILETPLVSKESLLKKLKILQNDETSIRTFLRDKHPEMIRGAQRNVEALADLLEQKR